MYECLAKQWTIFTKVTTYARTNLRLRNVKPTVLTNNSGSVRRREVLLRSYPYWKEMMSNRPVCSRAIIMAKSFASEPLFTKYTT